VDSFGSHKIHLLSRAAKEKQRAMQTQKKAQAKVSLVLCRNSGFAYLQPTKPAAAKQAQKASKPMAKSAPRVGGKR
jgi:hypothetical protein